MKDGRKEFIKEAHKAACNEWKSKIEVEFPDLFPKVELEVGKWYFDTTSKWALIYNSGNSSEGNYGFGRNVGEWTKAYNMRNTNVLDYRLATDKEVEEALIKEAKKRGFVEGVTVDCLLYSKRLDNVLRGKLEWDDMASEGMHLRDSKGNSVFSKGKWATIIEEPKPLQLTVSQIEEKYGCKVEVIS